MAREGHPCLSGLAPQDLQHLKHMFYVYVLKSKTNQKHYIGHTNNLERRLLYHNSGYSKSTKSGIPWELIYSEDYTDRSSAMKRESEMKSKKSRAFIDDLVAGRASR
jgi:putative endonuclease